MRVILDAFGLQNASFGDFYSDVLPHILSDLSMHPHGLKLGVLSDVPEAAVSLLLLTVRME